MARLRHVRLRTMSAAHWYGELRSQPSRSCRHPRPELHVAPEFELDVRGPDEHQSSATVEQELLLDREYPSGAVKRTSTCWPAT
jgi:hypothetical protein